MEFTGKIIVVCPAQGGTSKSSGKEWVKQDYVIEETTGQYPKKMCFNVFGADKIKDFDLKVNEEVTISFDVNAREYNGRWFNDISAWKVERGKPAPQAAPAQAQPAPQGDAFAERESDDPHLPF